MRIIFEPETQDEVSAVMGERGLALPFKLDGNSYVFRVVLPKEGVLVKPSPNGRLIEHKTQRERITAMLKDGVPVGEIQAKLGINNRTEIYKMRAALEGRVKVKPKLKVKTRRPHTAPGELSPIAQKIRDTLIAEPGLSVTELKPKIGVRFDSEIYKEFKRHPQVFQKVSPGHYLVIHE